MTLLILGSRLFWGYTPYGSSPMASATPGGEVRLNGWKAIYSIVSIAGFVLIVYGYGEARLTPVAIWSPPLWTMQLAALLTVPAFILLAAAYVPGTRIKRAVGHPMVAGVKVWAFAQLIANGTLADVCCSAASLPGRSWITFRPVAATALRVPST
jgi:uncharacterized membrane protein